MMEKENCCEGEGIVLKKDWRGIVYIALLLFASYPLAGFPFLLLAIPVTYSVYRALPSKVLPKHYWECELILLVVGVFISASIAAIDIFILDAKYSGLFY